MNILVVTEDSSYRLSVRNYLADEGFKLFISSSVKEGLRTIKADKIDLVISDLSMKYMDGFAFCKAAREQSGKSEMPFLFVYVSDDQISKINLELLKNCGSLRKGGPGSEIVKSIHRLISPEEPGGTVSSGASVPPEEMPTQKDRAAISTAAVGDKKYQHAHILIVDDDDNFRKVLGSMLADEGYDNLTSAKDGSEAITMLQNQKFDLVLLDIIMPNVSGFGVLKFIKENASHTKVVMLTAYADLKLAVESKKLGAVDFIAKPFMRDDLFKTIKQVLGA